MLASSLFILLFQSSPIQTTTATPDKDRFAAYEIRISREEQSPFKTLEMRSVGPRAMGARVVAAIGVPNQPHTYLVAYASGGLWRTTNQGTTWKPLFDQMPSITIGNIALDPNHPQRIWVGTGEDNSSRSSYAGTGIYLSDDGGKTWSHKGLADTHHISAVLVHPQNPNLVYVAVIGHLYTENPERGVYQSTDGGASWKKVLFINEKTGVIDLVMDPNNPNRLYAAAWERSRKAWNFVEAGPGSGIYISDDGGRSWYRAMDGLPEGENIGRIGLAIGRNQPQTIYAMLDFQETFPNLDPDKRPLTKKKLAEMDKQTLLGLKDSDIRGFLKRNNFHKDITVKKIRQQLEKDEITIQNLIDYIYDGNTALFDKTIHGAQIYRSDDRGKTWQKTHAKPIRSFVHSYGYYFGDISVDPHDADTIYVGGVPLLKSSDGGKTFKNTSRPGVHVDHHALWIDPVNSKHMVLGNDGGIYMSWDAGDHWLAFNYQAVGQFYTVAYDMRKPYNIYGGLQDNGVWFGPSQEQDRYHPPWQKIMRGDGAFVQVDPSDHRTVYAGYQFGHYWRMDLLGDDRLTIFPRHQLKERPYRFNWMTPFVLSQHQNDILYMGGNRVLRSLNRGQDWAPISPDLTTNPSQDGDVVYGTITALRESQKDFGTLYAGTDDGKLWISRGNYDEWRDLSQGIVQGLWVTSIETSPHEKSEVFVTLTGYRNDDFKAYLYHSKDFGTTWRPLNGDLPDEPCNVIRQDTKKPDLLYLGTDVGLWLSFDRGQHWLPYQHGLPKVPVYAMEVHPREHELIVATHGRSIFVLECQILAQLSPEKMDEPLLVLDLTKEEIHFRDDWGEKPKLWQTRPSEPPHTQLWFYAKKAGEAHIEILHEGKLVYRETSQATMGLNVFNWYYRVEPIREKGRHRKKIKGKDQRLTFHQGQDGNRYAIAGKYQLKVSMADTESQQTLTIKQPHHKP